LHHGDSWGEVQAPKYEVLPWPQINIHTTTNNAGAKLTAKGQIPVRRMTCEWRSAIPRRQLGKHKRNLKSPNARAAAFRKPKAAFKVLDPGLKYPGARIALETFPRKL
jgi:hypothetical protein